jgi:hypothetical protein
MESTIIYIVYHLDDSPTCSYEVSNFSLQKSMFISYHINADIQRSGSRSGLGLGIRARVEVRGSA